MRINLNSLTTHEKAKILVMSREIKPLAALYPPPPYKKSLVAEGGMLMPTAFAPLYIVSV